MNNKEIYVCMPRHRRAFGMVLFFTSKKCVACKELLPRLKSFCETDIKINIIDVEENPKIVNNYCVSSLPTLIYMLDGKPKRQLTGSVSDNLLKEWLNKDE